MMIHYTKVISSVNLYVYCTGCQFPWYQKLTKLCALHKCKCTYFRIRIHVLIHALHTYTVCIYRYRNKCMHKGMRPLHLFTLRQPIPVFWGLQRAPYKCKSKRTHAALANQQSFASSYNQFICLVWAYNVAASTLTIITLLFVHDVMWMFNLTILFFILILRDEML